MKRTQWLRYLLLSMIAGFAFEVYSQTNTVAPPVQLEKAEVTVTKVYTAQDEGARFRGYAVKWKGQEILVIDPLSDPLSDTLYREGDTINIYVYRDTEGHNGQALSFSLKPRIRRIPFRQG